MGQTGISSTAADLFLWDKALRNNKLFSTSAFREMTAPYVVKDSVNKIYFGYGVLTGANEFGTYIQQRDDGNNATLGYITTLIRYLKQDVTLIVLANKAKSSSNIAGVLAYILFDKEVVPPYIHKAFPIDTSLLEKYFGEYAVPAHIRVYKKEGTLWMTNPGEPDLKLLPESPIKFFSINKEYDWQIEFEKSSNGNVTKTYFIFNGLKKEIKRL